MDILLLILLLVFSAAAVFAKDILKSALSLAVASIFLAILFFRMNAPYAGVFEISVVAGLITVLFVSTIALTGTGAELKERKWTILVFPLFFIIVLILDYILIKKLTGTITNISNVIPGVGAQGLFADVLWKERTFDLIGQISIIFAGVFTVLALFRKEK